MPRSHTKPTKPLIVRSVEIPHFPGRALRRGLFHTTGIVATVTRLSLGEWYWTWIGGTPPFDIWLDGEKVGDAIAARTFELEDSRYPDEAPPIEIVSAGGTAENYLYPPRVRVQWRGVQSATAYVVEYYNGTAWIGRHHVMERGAGYYSWESLALADAQTHQFRVIALDLRNNEGTPLEFDIDLVRNPAPPSVAFSVSSSGDIVVSEG